MEKIILMCTVEKLGGEWSA